MSEAITKPQSTATEQVVLPDDDAAAKPHTMNGWLSRTGRFYGPNDERTARWDGATHLRCACGEVHTKHYTSCNKCIEKARHERWLALPLVEWDGKTPLMSDRVDEFFFDDDSVYEYCAENELTVADLDLVVCDPNLAREIDADYFDDELAEDGELPADIEDAMEAFNAALRAHGPLSWGPGKQRVILPECEQDE